MFTEKEKEFLNKQLKSIKNIKGRQLQYSRNGLIKVSDAEEEQLEKEIKFIQVIQDKIRNLLGVIKNG